MPSATKDSWKTQPKPTQHERLNYEAQFSEAEVSQIAEGLVPQCMEDKWFIFLEGGWLHFHRSWTGSLIYWLRLEEVSAGCYQVAEAHVSRDADQYKELDLDYDLQLLDFLLRRFLLHQDAAFPIKNTDDNPPGVYQHHIAGSGFPERTVKKPWWRFW